MRIDGTTIMEITNSNQVLEGREESGRLPGQKGESFFDILHAPKVEDQSYDRRGVNPEDGQQVGALPEQSGASYIKDEMRRMANSLTGHDYAMLKGEGFWLEDTEIDTVVTVVDKIKIAMAASRDYEQYGEEISADQLRQYGGSDRAAFRLAARMKGRDIPVTEENMRESLEAMKTAASLTEVGQGTQKYMIENEMAPTIDSIYRAEHSGINSYYRYEPQALPQDEGLQRQIQAVIQEAGLDGSGEAQAGAQWMINNDLPLTGDTLRLKTELDHLNFPLEEETVMDAIVSALERGQRPLEASLIPQKSDAQRGQEALATIQNATGDQLEALTEEGKSLTIENLATLQGSPQHQAQGAEQGATPGPVEQEAVQAAPAMAFGMDTGADGNGADARGESNGAEADGDIALVKARRQLEEVRLKMTVEANIAMLRKGIQIETRPLDKLVEDLTAIEQEYYGNLFRDAGLEPTGENISLYRQALEKTEALKITPAYILGQAPFVDENQDFAAGNPTVNAIVENGAHLRKALEKASQTYETLKSAPLQELGDSFEKAFQNIPDILGDLGLEATEDNMRAVRILGYNNIAIDEASILQVKAADSQVQALIRNMTPGVTLHMIKNKINPLETNIYDLNREIGQLKEAISGEREEKYSKFLWKLERNREVTPEEREAFIGMYRLLRSVEKTDGAVIGVLVEQNMDITMKNLLRGLRTSRGRDRGLDVSVDSAFGILDSVASQRKSIAEQLAGGFWDGGSAFRESPQEQFSSDKEEQKRQNTTVYHTNLAKELTETLAPEKLKALGQTASLAELSPEQLAEQMRLLQEDGQLEEEYQQSRLEEFARMSNAEPEVIRMLTDSQIPVTLYNLMAISRMQNRRNSLFQTVLQEDPDKRDPDLEAVKEKLLKDFAEALETPEEMARAQKALADTAENVMDTMMEAEGATSVDLREIRLMRQELKLHSLFAKEERYAIPVLVGDEVTTISLKIVRGEEEKGKVAITLEHGKLGRIAAELKAEGDSLTGYVAASTKEGLGRLQERQGELEENLLKNFPEKVSIQYIENQDLDLRRVELASGRGEQLQPGEERPVQTRDLYFAARELITAISRS